MISPNRRFFLKGMGTSLAIPLLPSLLSPREAAAQQAANRRAFIMFSVEQGGIWPQHIFPSSGPDIEQRTYAGRNISRFRLQANQVGDQSVISPVLSASSSQLSASLISKMFSIQGLDIPFYMAHHTGGYLGNFARKDFSDFVKNTAARPTIDQIMARSSAFYGANDPFRHRVMSLSPDLSFDYSNPQSRSGSIQPTSVLSNNPRDLFNQLFPDGGPSSTPPTPEPPPLVVDRVFESYRRLRDSSRISQNDRIRLEDHMQRIDELERSLGSRPAAAGCQSPTLPTGPLAERGMLSVNFNKPHSRDPNSHATYFQHLNDMIVAAVSCGVSRIAVTRILPIFSTFTGDWHQNVAHRADRDVGQQDILYRSYQRVFSDVIVDLANKLNNVQSADGNTLLDDSLLVWNHEFGPITHNSHTIPVIGFGSAGGNIQTGYHVDYRGPNSINNPTGADHLKLFPGLLWHQWLGQVLTAMNIPKSEYEGPENGGYPNFRHVSNANVGRALSEDQAYPESVWQAAGQPLPWIGAGA